MLTAAHVVLLGEDADAQACVAAALPPVALGRLRHTCHGASGAAPVGVDWARLCPLSGLAARGELRALQYLYLHDKDYIHPWDILPTTVSAGRGAVVAWILGKQEHSSYFRGKLVHVIASASDPEVIRLLIAAGAEHLPDALLCAVQHGNLAFLTAVLDTGVHPDSEPSLPNSNYYSPRHALISACESGHLSCARALLAAGGDVDRLGPYGFALWGAARKGHLECMRLLLEHGTDVDRLGRDGSALSGAAFYGQLECMRLLLRYEADVNARIDGGQTSLMQAACTGHAECVQLLIEHTADVHARDRTGGTALNCDKTSADPDLTECTRALLAAGADVNAVDDSGRTALMNAAIDGDQSLSLLLEAGADVNAADGGGCTALLHAARYGVQSLSLLLDAGADVHATDPKGFTPMLLACCNGYMQTVLLLDGHGADPRAVCADGTTALMMACENCHGDIVRWLIEKNIDLDAVQHGNEGRTALAISSGDQRRMLIEAGADLDATDARGWTLLMHGCENGDLDNVHELIAAGANTDVLADAADTYLPGNYICAMDLAKYGRHWDCVIAVAQARRDRHN